MKKAILLAGGAGTRLFPLTKIVCKQLLPIYDKPMICYPLATLMLGGLREVLIITTPKDLPMLRDYLNDGAQLGIRIEYAEQPKPEGIAQAFLIAAKFTGGSGASLIQAITSFMGNSISLRLAIERGACILISGVTRSAVACQFDAKGSDQSQENRSTRKVILRCRGCMFTTSALSIFAEPCAHARGELESRLNLLYLGETAA